MLYKQTKLIGLWKMQEVSDKISIFQTSKELYPTKPTTCDNTYLAKVIDQVTQRNQFRDASWTRSLHCSLHKSSKSRCVDLFPSEIWIIPLIAKFPCLEEGPLTAILSVCRKTVKGPMEVCLQCWFVKISDASWKFCSAGGPHLALHW